MVDKQRKTRKDKPKAACIDAEQSLIAGLMVVQYQKFVKHFAKEEGNVRNNTTPTINMAGKLDQKNVWVIDSGATEHITCKTY